MQSLLATRREDASAGGSGPLTSPGPLVERLRWVGQRRLLTNYVRCEGSQVAHLVRKSVEARDWLTCLEPRAVRPVIKRRMLEDLASVDHQVRLSVLFLLNLVHLYKEIWIQMLQSCLS